MFASYKSFCDGRQTNYCGMEKEFLLKKIGTQKLDSILKNETSYTKPINNLPICKEKNFPLNDKRL